VTGLGPRDLEFLEKRPVDGILLSDRLAEGPLPAQEALQYAVDIGTALKKAHERGVVHGALSPHTIRLTENGARIVEPAPQSIARGAACRAPEQVRGEQPDTRSDVYAFGAVLYEMVAGTSAFHGDGPELNRSILNDPPPTLTLRSPVYSAIASVIDGCLEKNQPMRRQRIQNAVIELRFAAKGAGRSARPAAIPPLSRPVMAPAPIDDGAPATTPSLDAVAAIAPPAMPSRPRAAGPKPRAAEPPAADSFFFKPGEPVVRMRATLEPVGWRALFGPEGKLALSSFRVRIVGFIAVCLVLVGGLMFAAVSYLKPRNSSPVLKFAVNAPENTSFPGSPAVSPDGRNLAFSAQGPEGKRTLWLRPLDALRNTPISGTEGATNPFWSPDGQSLAYFASQTLRIVRLKDYQTETVCKVDGANGGGTWNKDNTILYSRGIDDGLYKVAGKGASIPAPVLRVRPDKGETGFLWPQFLPDGKHFIFFVQTESADTTGVYGASIDGAPDAHLLMASETNAVYSALPEAPSQKNGYLLYIAGRKLMGQAFNAPKMGLAGEPMTLADDIGPVRSLALAPISVATNATLVYQSTGKPTRQLAWLDRSGNEITEVRDAGEWGPPRIAPDGRRAIVGKLPVDTDSADLWTIDLNGAASQLTSTASHEGSPVWSPDGSKIASFVASKQEPSYDLYVRQAETGSRPDLLLRSPQAKYPTDWSRDGRYIFFNVLAENTKYDVWAVSTADRRAGPILDTVNVERDAVLSPDGKWLAYDSDESGRLEVYVQPFSGIDSTERRRWKISTAGAALPKWRADGKELFFITTSGKVMSTAVHPSGEVFEFEPPAKLFQTRPIPKVWNFFDVSPDGQKFLVNLPIEWASSSQIMVVTNWTEKLKD
jgi:eukaryotic-like serine/threonine-protein kinase